MKNKSLLGIIRAGLIAVVALNSGCAYRHQVYQTELGKLTGAASVAVSSKPVYFKSEIETPSGELRDNATMAVSADIRLGVKHSDVRRLTFLGGLEAEHDFMSSCVGDYQKGIWAEKDNRFYQLTPDSLILTPYFGAKLDINENYFANITFGAPITKLRLTEGEVLAESWNRQGRETEEVIGKRIGIGVGKKRLCNSPRDPGVEVHLDFTRYNTQFFDKEGNLDLLSACVIFSNLF